MDALSGIGANLPPFTIGASGSLIPTSGVLASGLNSLTAGLFGGTSTIVELSGAGQLLSAAATFQDRLAALQPGTATSGGGQNFGTDLASLAAEAQSFVDSFNSLQTSIAGINGASTLLGGSIPGAAGLVQALDSQALAAYSNGNSALTRLAQIGIVFQPAQVFGGSTRLSIDLDTLESAFNADAAGAFSLLSSAADALGEVAGNFVVQSGSTISTLASLGETLSINQLLSNSLLFQSSAGGTLNFANLLALEALAPGGLGGASTQQVILALNQYNLISQLLG